MEGRYNKIYLLDTENLGSGFVKKLCSLSEDDLVVAIYTEHSARFTYGQLQYFIDCKAKFHIEEVKVGTANALDFQISTLLGFLIHKVDVEGVDTEFIILSHDMGYCGVVQYWRNRGKKVSIKGDIDAEEINVEEVLSSLTYAQRIKALKGQKDKLAQSVSNIPEVGTNTDRHVNLQKAVISATNSAIDKFNKRLEKTESIKAETDKKTEVVKTEQIEKPTSFTLSLSDLESPKDLKKNRILKNADEETDSDIAANKKISIKINEDLIILSTSNKTTMYRNIYARCKQVEGQYEDVLYNSERVVKIARVSPTDSIIFGYIIYVGRSLAEIEEYLSKVVNTDSKLLTIKAILKKVEHNMFINKYGL